MSAARGRGCWGRGDRGPFPLPSRRTWGCSHESFPNSWVRVCQDLGHFHSRASRTAARGLQDVSSPALCRVERAFRGRVARGGLWVMVMFWCSVWVLASPVCLLFQKIDELRSYDLCSFQHVVVLNKKKKEQLLKHSRPDVVFASSLRAPPTPSRLFGGEEDGVWLRGTRSLIRII